MLPMAIRQAASLSDFHAFVSVYLGLPVSSHMLLVNPFKKIIRYYYDYYVMSNGNCFQLPLVN